MSDNHRRAIFRIVFLLTCFLPTGVVGYWICHPQTASNWERAIQAELGLNTEIDSIVTPGPNVTILTGLKLRDAEGTLLFETVEAKVEFGAFGGNGTAKGNRVVFPYKVEHLTNQGIGYLVKTLKDNLVHKKFSHSPWKIVFEEDASIQRSQDANSANPELKAGMSPLELVSSLKISGLELDLGAAIPEDGTLAVASFLVSEKSSTNSLANGEGGPEQDRVPVVCNLSKTERHGSYLEFSTNGASLPCWLFADSMGILRPLGDQATFSGEVKFQQPSPSQTIVDVAGVFRDVDLGPWGVVVNQSTESRAKIDVIQCRFNGLQKEAWHVVLHTDQDSMHPGIQVNHTSMFDFSTKIDIANAFDKTLAPITRSASNGSNLK